MFCVSSKMELDLLPYIESLDDTPNSERLLDSIYPIIKSRIENPHFDQEVCDKVFQMYNRLCREQRLSESYAWWNQNFSLYKNIRYSLECKLIEPALTDIERMSNLHLIDSILFYIKLMCLQLQIHSRNHTED